MAALLASGELACGWIGRAARMLYGFVRSQRVHLGGYGARRRCRGGRRRHGSTAVTRGAAVSAPRRGAQQSSHKVRPMSNFIHIIINGLELAFQSHEDVGTEDFYLSQTLDHGTLVENRPLILGQNGL